MRLKSERNRFTWYLSTSLVKSSIVSVWNYIVYRRLLTRWGYMLWWSGSHPGTGVQTIGRNYHSELFTKGTQSRFLPLSSGPSGIIGWRWSYMSRAEPNSGSEIFCTYYRSGRNCNPTGSPTAPCMILCSTDRFCHSPVLYLLSSSQVLSKKKSQYERVDTQVKRIARVSDVLDRYCL